jgi:hypothetical protein
MVMAINRACKHLSLYDRFCMAHQMDYKNNAIENIAVLGQVTRSHLETGTRHEDLMLFDGILKRFFALSSFMLFAGESLFSLPTRRRWSYLVALQVTMRLHDRYQTL